MTKRTINFTLALAFMAGLLSVTAPAQDVLVTQDSVALTEGPAKRFNVELHADAPRMNQERAYTSPIWYTP